MDLGKAEEGGRFIRVTCTWCRRSHVFYPRDIIRLIGNVPFLYLEEYFHCTGCDKGAYMKVKIEAPSAEERIGLVVRKLVEIKTVRRPIWKDEKL